MSGSAAFGVQPGASVAVIANRSSGLLAQRASPLDLVVDALSVHGFYPRIFVARQGGLGEAVAACRAEAPDLVFVIGGDGTVLAAAEAFAGTPTVLAIVPHGTVNQLARDLDIALDPALAVAALAGGTARAIDVGRVNGRVFVCTSVVGPLAKLQRYRERARGRFLATLLSFVLAAGKALTLRPMRLAIEDGDTAWREDSRGVIVSVNAFARSASRIPRRETLEGGRLAVYAAREHGRLPLLKLGAAILAGRGHDDPNIIYHETRALQVRSRRRRMAVLNDGEMRLVETPLRFQVQPGALRVLAPAPS